MVWFDSCWLKLISCSIYLLWCFHRYQIKFSNSITHWLSMDSVLIAIVELVPIRIDWAMSKCWSTSIEMFHLTDFLLLRMELIGIILLLGFHRGPLVSTKVSYLIDKYFKQITYVSCMTMDDFYQHFQIGQKNGPTIDNYPL